MPEAFVYGHLFFMKHQDNRPIESEVLVAGVVVEKSGKDPRWMRLKSALVVIVPFY